MNFDYKRLMKFETNVGLKEMKIRLIIGSVLIGISLFSADIIMILVGVILVATGYLQTCPVNTVMERNSCEAE